MEQGFWNDVSSDSFVIELRLEEKCSIFSEVRLAYCGFWARKKTNSCSKGSSSFSEPGKLRNKMHIAWPPPTRVRERGKLGDMSGCDGRGRGGSGLSMFRGGSRHSILLRCQLYNLSVHHEP